MRKAGAALMYFFGKNAVWIVCCITLCAISANTTQSAEQPESTFYSIHVASFIQLENANRFVNSLQTRGKAVFWKETDVPGKGMYYRVYLGKYSNMEKAAAFWEQLKKEGAVTYFGVHAFTEPAQPQPREVAAADIPVQTPKKEATVSSGMPNKPAPGKKGRFIDHGNGTVTDTRTGLMWVKNGWRLDFFSALQWKEAKDRCRTFSLAGYDDWRLPTINEWAGLIDRKQQYPAVASPNPFENIIVHMPYWSGSEYQYKIDASHGRRSSLETYTVMLYAGTIHHQKKTARAFVMPVRSSN